MKRTALAVLLVWISWWADAAGLGPFNSAQHAVNGFMPTQIAGLQLWLDANRLCLPSGTNVDVWQDFSRKSNWATNGTANKRPIVRNINGRSSAYFDGTNDFLTINSFLGMTEVTVFVAMNQSEPIEVGQSNIVTYANGDKITLFDNGNASPYPTSLSNIHVPGIIKEISVTISNFSHNWPDDIDIYLMGPTNSTGGKNTMLLSDAGGDFNITNITMTFSSTSTNLPGDNSALTSGTYAPSNYETNADSFFATNATFDPFIGTAANGTWRMYLRDDLSGDGGTITNGWYLTVTYEKVERMLVEHGNNSIISNGFYFQGSKNCAWSVNRSSLIHSSCSSNNAIEETWISTGPAVSMFSYSNSGVVKKNGEAISGLSDSGTTITNNSLTNNFYIASRNGTELFYDGHISEVIVFTNKLSDVQERNIFRYLGTKYGVAVK